MMGLLSRTSEGTQRRCGQLCHENCDPKCVRDCELPVYLEGSRLPHEEVDRSTVTARIGPPEIAHSIAHSLRTRMIQDDPMQQTTPLKQPAFPFDLETAPAMTPVPEVEVPREAPQPHLLMTVTEAARALRIGRRQTWEMVWRNELPVVRLGPRTIRIARPVLEQFMLDRSLPYGAPSRVDPPLPPCSEHSALSRTGRAR